MGSTIIYDYSGNSKSREDNAFEKLNNYICVVRWGSYCFDPFLLIINSDQDVFILVGGRERTHEIYPPTVEYFYL